MSVLRRTKEEFVARWRHDLIGVLNEALATPRPGADPVSFAEFGRKSLELIDKAIGRLEQYWDDLAPLKIEPPKGEPPKVSKDSAAGYAAGVARGNGIKV
jgi:hypothetical protein